MNLSANTVWKDLDQIRKTAPLIHNITNFVVMNNTANALLALGASPVMAHAVNEVEEMVKLASALVVNIGTLSDDWVAAMQMAMLSAKQLHKPIVFDPVGVGATSYRTATARQLLDIATPTVIRGNASEISGILAENSTTKGVDSTEESTAAILAAQNISQYYNCTVVISGVIDFIVSQKQIFRVENGHPMMGKVTGMGCTATAIIAAFLAVNPNSVSAATHAMAVMGIAGEIAAEKATGPGSLQVQFLDTLYNLKIADIETRLKLSR